MEWTAAEVTMAEAWEVVAKVVELWEVVTRAGGQEVVTVPMHG